MSTENLIDACINFPLFGYYTAFNTPQEGFNIMFSRFNIFNKICEKENIGQHLIMIYQDAGTNGWQQFEYKFGNEYWTIKLNYLEYLIAQNGIVSRLSQKDKTELVKIAKTKLIEKVNHESFNSLPGISSTLLLMSKILESSRDRSAFPEKGEIQRFLSTGFLYSTEIIEDILKSADIYLTY
jgi:hypothetical protein